MTVDDRDAKARGGGLYITKETENAMTPSTLSPSNRRFPFLGLGKGNLG